MVETYSHFHSKWLFPQTHQLLFCIISALSSSNHFVFTVHQRSTLPARAQSSHLVKHPCPSAPTGKKQCAMKSYIFLIGTKNQILSSVLNLRLLNQEKLQQCNNMQIWSDHSSFSLFPIGLNKGTKLMLHEPDLLSQTQGDTCCLSSRGTSGTGH